MPLSGKKTQEEYSFSNHLIIRALKAVATNGGSYDATDLSMHFIGCNKCRRAHFLAFLRRKGFVTIDKNESKSRNVVLTEKGRQVISHLLSKGDNDKKSTYTHYRLDPNKLAALLNRGNLDDYLASAEGEKCIDTFATPGRRKWA